MSKSKMPRSLERELSPIQARNGIEIQKNNRSYIDFSSNDYLGLSHHKEIQAAMKSALETYPLGSTGSRLLSGDYELSADLETKLATFFHKPSSLIFNTGYQLNISVFKTLFSSKDLILADKWVHASLIEGCLASGANLKRFKHNSLDHLSTLLTRYRDQFDRVVIVTESVFSMDGDTAPLKELVTIKKRFKTLLYVDEAHALGVFGETGAGLSEAQGLRDDIDFIVGTFGKAFGLCGAVIATDTATRKELIQSCKGFIYSTALPPVVIAGIHAALSTVSTMTSERAFLQTLAKDLRSSLVSAGFQTRGETQIVPIVFETLEQTLSCSQYLQDAGFHALPIRPPTVPKTETRIRLSLSSEHSKDHMTRLLSVLCDWQKAAHGD
jgi:8-amino-7-oxononanoate synthase